MYGCVAATPGLHRLIVYLYKTYNTGPRQEFCCCGQDSICIETERVAIAESEAAIVVPCVKGLV
jgi:hypothetical protein